MKLNNNLKTIIKNLGYREDIILYLIACRLNIDTVIDDDIFISLIKNNIIERDYINEKIIVKIPLFEDDEIEFIPNKFDNIKNISERIDEYRSKFKGIRTKSIGDKNTTVDKMTAWLLKNPNFTYEDVLEATDFYIQNTEPQYISNADNFIFNYDTKGNLVSGLSIVIDTIRMGTLEKRFN
jgi:hypothetical protein